MRASITYDFFCVVTPGLEQLARQEYLDKLTLLGVQDPSCQLILGGLIIRLPWEKGRGLGHVLKLPTRILVRLGAFSARDFPRFYQKISQLPWHRWLSHPEPLVKISAQQCRLIQTQRLTETFQQGLLSSFLHQPLSNRWQKQNLEPETVYLRGDNDTWTISLDLSGEPLYKRGLSEIKGAAPLRETLAAGLLRFMFQDYQGQPLCLWDPMCGSGTFLTEALNHYHPQLRPMSYESCQLNLGVAPWKMQHELPSWRLKLIGSDLNAELIEKITPIQGIDWYHHDFFASKLLPQVESPLWIISNPPYGERLALGNARSQFIEHLTCSLARYSPERILLLVPQDWPGIKINGQKHTTELRFKNGGIPVCARLWQT